MAILYVASEAAELKPLANLLTGLRKLKWPIDYAYEGIWQSRRILLAANGAGPTLAAKVVEIGIRAGMAAELSASRLETVVSTGFCGALDPSLREGGIVVASAVLGAAGDQLFQCASVTAEQPFTSGLVLSQDRIANDVMEKNQLFARGAVAVDMEAAGVAERAKRAGLHFCCIKVVSDRADESFPFDLNTMRSIEGRIVRGKIIVHALSHPRVIPALHRLKRRTEDAAGTLGEFLVSCRIAPESNGTQPDNLGF